MTDCNSLRRGTSKLLELVPNPFDLFNKLCSKQNVFEKILDPRLHVKVYELES